MKCTKCGFEADNGKFCPECGNQFVESVKKDANEEIGNAHLYEEGAKDKITYGKHLLKSLKRGIVVLFIMGVLAFVIDFFSDSSYDKNESSNQEEKENQEVDNSEDFISIEEYLDGCINVTNADIARNPNAYIGKDIIIEGELGNTMDALSIGLWSTIHPITIEYDGVAYDANFNPMGKILNTDYGYVAGKYTAEDTIQAVIVVVTNDEANEVKEVDEKYIFADSDSVYYSEEQLIRAYDYEMIWLGKNEIYARHGYIFKNDELKNYFEKQSWYKGTVSSKDFSEAEFNKYEKANIKTMQNIIDSYNQNTDTAVVDNEYYDINGNAITVKPGKYINSDSPLIFNISEPFYDEDDTLCVDVYIGTEEDEYLHVRRGIPYENWKEIWTGYGNFAYDGEEETISGDGLDNLIHYLYDKELEDLYVADKYYWVEGW